MINSAEEFVTLRISNSRRAALDNAPEAVWLDVINRFPEMREWVAVNKTLPESIHWHLVRDPDPRVRYQVADRRQLTEDMLVELAKDKDETVRHRVGWNKRTPRLVLEQLAQDSSSFVAETARERLAKLK